jgi:hypothetical protein
LSGIAMRRKTFVKRHLTEIMILPASLNITLVLITAELSCASHTYTPKYITIPGTAVLSCQYENDPALRWWQRGSIISQDSTINP